MAEPNSLWHAGRTVGRTIYRGDGPNDMVGVMMTRELAAYVVERVNGYEQLRAALEAAHDALERAALRLQVLGDYPSPRDAFAARDAARYALDGDVLSDAAQAARGGEEGE